MKKWSIALVSLSLASLGGCSPADALSPAPAGDAAGSTDSAAAGLRSTTALTVTNLANGAAVSGTITISGRAGSNWVNVAAYANGAKVSADVTPTNRTYSLSVDTTQLANGAVTINVTAFSVAAGQPGGTSRTVNLTVNVSNQVASPAPSAPAPPSPSAPAPSPATSATMLGVYVGNDAPSLTHFEQWLGRKVDGALGYTGQVDWNDMDPTWIISQFSGRNLYFSIPLFPNTSSLAAVANGAGDGYFRQYAQTILTSGTPAPDGNFYVRTAWETPGEWMTWGVQGAASPSDFVTAFQHFAQVFHDASPKFQVVWDVTSGRGGVEQYYPGDAYVDVMSQDFYWEPQWSSTDPVAGFAFYRDDPAGLQWLETFAAAHGKKTAYSEWGVKGDNAGPFIEQAKAWFDAHHPVYQTYWNSNAAYAGMLSNDQYPTTGATYRRIFGP